MDEVFATVAGTGIVIGLMLSGAMGEALTLGQALASWLNGVLPA